MHRDRGGKCQGLCEREMIRLSAPEGFWKESREFHHGLYPEPPKCRMFGPEEPVDHLQRDHPAQGVGVRGNARHTSPRVDEPCGTYGDRSSLNRVHQTGSGLKKCKRPRIQSAKLFPLSPTLNKPQSFAGLRLILSKAPSNSDIL